MVRINLNKRPSSCGRALWVFGAVLVACLVSMLATSCSFYRPATETPVPRETGISKSFFQNIVTENALVQAAKYDEKGRLVSAAKYEKRSSYRPKTFLCGWAPITETGFIAESSKTHAVHMAGHCNIEFEVTKNFLIGRLINPSRLDDRNFWKQVILIPITKHYYYEKAKDNVGRETNEFIENDTRSDWSARPNMDLNLAGLSIMSWDGLLTVDGASATTKVSDIEWDDERNFLGFTLDVVSKTYGSEDQGRFRFNFLKFEHNEKFAATPYSSENSSYLNALHILGEVEQGIKPILYAAHWDTNKKHTFYTHGMPEKVFPLAQQVVNAWNDVFEKDLKLGRPFALSNEAVNKYGFDLRYPSMTWVEDPSISVRSPLGVGMALADVKNGEILWGQLTLYGGFLERYIKNFLPANGGGTQASLSGLTNIQIPMLGKGFFGVPTQFVAPPELRNFSGAMASATLSDALSKKLSNALPGEEKALEPAQVAKLQEQANALIGESKELAENIANRTAEQGAHLSVPEMIRLPVASSEASAKLFGDNFKTLSPEEIGRKLQQKSILEARYASGSVVFDLDRTIEQVAPGWAAALSGGTKNYEEAYETVVRELLMHEFGHVIGLGHQFKENILPAKGTVPPSIFNKLSEEARTFSNATSVMGYKHPFTEINEPGDKVAPGPHDVLVLQYLYNRKFATYKKDSGEENFRFVDLPKNGKIPPKDPSDASYTTSYFPQCNDLHASFSLDPYCNRFDRGYNAETIVQGYFDDLNNNLVSSIYPFADVRGGNPGGTEAYLWSRSLSVMGRIRIFYDYMRQRYADQINKISKNEKSLYEFSRACSKEITASDELAEMFWLDHKTDRKIETELGQLCRVNRLAVQGFRDFLTNPGPDNTEMDWDNSYVPSGLTGGDAQLDYSRADGTFTTLSVLPLKIAAMNALTTARPYFNWSGWLIPIPRYSDQQGLFSYAPLYPFEFTQAMAATVEKNLKFSSPSSQVTSMGASIMSMGHFLNQLNYSNEALRFPRTYLETINEQAKFRLSLVVVIMNFRGREKDSGSGPMNVTNFETTIYDYRTGKHVTGTEAYLLPGGRVVLRPPNRTFLFPITKFSFSDDRSGYVHAYRVDYDKKFDDVLKSHSVKTTFEEMHKNVIDSCLNGKNDGLSNYFVPQNSEFQGFQVLPGISHDSEMQIRFLNSVDQAFSQYKEKKSADGLTRCEESIKGLGLITSSVAMVNGYLLPEALEYMVKK